MIDREALAKAIDLLSRNNFIIEAEGNIKIPLCFKSKAFFHLLGFQHIKDIPRVCNAKNKGSFIKEFLRDDVLVQQVQKSAYFEEVRPRIETFSRVCDMLISDQCEIIIEFDPSKLSSTKLRSRFLLYKTDDYTTYYLLGIAVDDNGAHYPETYIVEPSRYYVANQKLLSCKISVCPLEESNKKQNTSVKPCTSPLNAFARQ